MKVLLLVAAMLGSAEGFAQMSDAEATALVRRAIEHRVAEEKTARPVEYVFHKVDGTRDRTQEIVETRDGDVARLIALDGKPLSAEANQAEIDRLKNLEAHPELQEHRKRNEERDRARVTRMMAMLPNAFVYHVEATESCAGAPCYRMSYAPRPGWTPPDMEAGIFRGISGEVWIDQRQERLTKLVANFVQDVNFGFGILGRVSKGGRVVLEQGDIGGGEWQLLGMTAAMQGKALLVKKIDIDLKEEMSGFKVVPEMGYKEAVEMLLK
jgi:hypothetical protein